MRAPSIRSIGMQSIKSFTLIGLGLLAVHPTLAYQDNKQNDAAAEYYRGYYLQHESDDLAGALKAYRQSIQLGADNELREKIDEQTATLQEELAVQDFAGIMPANAIAFVEISNPASHVEKVAGMMGLIGTTNNANDRVVLNIDNEVQIPSDFKISPALIRELKKIRGAAIGITKINPNGQPAGLAVIHPGDSDPAWLKLVFSLYRPTNKLVDTQPS